MSSEIKKQPKPKTELYRKTVAVIAVGGAAVGGALGLASRANAQPNSAQTSHEIHGKLPDQSLAALAAIQEMDKDPKVVNAIIVIPSFSFHSKTMSPPIFWEGPVSQQDPMVTNLDGVFGKPGGGAIVTKYTIMQFPQPYTDKHGIDWVMATDLDATPWGPRSEHPDPLYTAANTAWFSRWLRADHLPKGAYLARIANYSPSKNHVIDAKLVKYKDPYSAYPSITKPEPHLHVDYIPDGQAGIMRRVTPQELTSMHLVKLPDQNLEHYMHS